MTDETDPKEALSEIHRLLSLSTVEDSKVGRAVTQVWAGLSIAAGVVCAILGVWEVRWVWAYCLVWVAHNALGWTATLWLKRRQSQDQGRDSHRGNLICRTWAVLNLAIWLIVWLAYRTDWVSPMALNPLACLLCSVGIFVTGLLCEDVRPQWIGTGMAASAIILPTLVAPGLAFWVQCLVWVVGMGAWGLSARFARKAA